MAFDIAGGITSGIGDGGAALASGQFGAGFGTTAHIFKVASHAGIGCVSAMAAGGKCGAGALSAGVSAGATPFYATGSDAGNVAVAALVGGAASVAGGGSFAEGATTAAFGYLFNQAMSTARSLAGNARRPRAHDWALHVGRHDHRGADVEPGLPHRNSAIWFARSVRLWAARALGRAIGSSLLGIEVAPGLSGWVTALAQVHAPL